MLYFNFSQGIIHTPANSLSGSDQEESDRMPQ